MQSNTLRAWLILLVSLIATLGFAEKAASSPYIGTEDKQLHRDLQTLSEWGYVHASVTSYPVPWRGVAQQIEHLSADNMQYMPKQALRRLQHHLKVAKTQKQRSFVQVQANSQAPRISSFDGSTYHQAAATIKHQALLDRVYVQGVINIDQDGELNLDNSLIAYQFENWQVRVGAIDQFWGPGQSSSLILSNNARPTPSIAVSRASTNKSKSPWLSWLGSWYYTGQLSQLESDRVVPNAKLMLNRFTFTPFKRLEIGASWAVTWGGDTQPEGFREFLDVITFRKTCLKPSGQCNEQEVTKQGNHLAGFDVSFSFDAFNRPFTLYAQRIGEDAVNNIQITDNANLIGMSTYLGRAKVFIETSDTNIACASQDSTITNCYYEHGTYQTGYRHQGRAIGSTFDSDAKQITLGTNYRFSDGAIAEVLLSKADLNPDNIRPTSILEGATSEELLLLQGFYQRPLGDWLFKAGGLLENRERPQLGSQTNVSLYIDTTYSF